MTNLHWSLIADATDRFPVFHGMEKVGLTGKDIADVVGMSAATISKWRNGKVRVPGEIIALLTLVLCNRIEELRDQLSNKGAIPGRWQFQARAGLDSALDDLLAQERLNTALPPEDVREGAQRFRHWWVAKGKSASRHVDAQTSSSESRPFG